MLACMCVFVPHICRCSEKPEEGIRSSGAGIADGGRLQCGCWDLNSGPLQKQQVLLNCQAISPVPAQAFVFHFAPLK